MGLLSRKLGFWARCAAVACGLLAVAPAALAGTPSKSHKAHAHGPAAKRAAPATKSKASRAGTTKPVVLDDTAKGAKPVAKAEPKADSKADSKAVAKREPAVPATSVGSPNEGKLVGGVKLDTKDASIRVVPAYARGDTRWGLPALVHMLERSAKKVAKSHPGSVLGVGDISRKNGGDIFLHRSHESGRDADIAFYVIDYRGKNFLPDTFVQFQGTVESTSMQGVRFDVARNWALVQAWLEDPVARVSHIFVADPLRRMLLAHAKPRVSPALYNRAAAVMMQPSNALPHDNHFHVRISCPADTRKSCVEYPVGVKLAKKGKGKPALVTPKGKAGSEQAIAQKGKPAVRNKAQGQSRRQVPSQGQSHAQAGVAKTPAKAPGTAPKAAPAERKLANTETPKKKPIYLQSAVANTDDPLDRVLFSVPALSHLTGGDDNGDADGVDVKASVDESGTVKITD